MDFKKAIELFCQWRLDDEQRSPYTVKSQKRIIRNFGLYIGMKKVEDITMEDLVSYMINGVRKCGRSTNYRLAKGIALRHFFRFLQLQNLNEKTLDPDLIPLPKRHYEIPRIADQENYQKLINSLSKRKNHYPNIRSLALIGLLWDSGASNRILISLDTCDINLENRTAIVKVKGAKEAGQLKKISWSEETNNNLRRWLKARRQLINKAVSSDHHALFISIGGEGWGERLSVNGFGRMLRKCSKKAGLAYVMSARSFQNHKTPPIRKRWLSHQQSNRQIAVQL